MSSYFAAYQPETAVETSLQGFDIPQEFHLFTHRAVSIADGTEVPGRRVVWGAVFKFFLFLRGLGHHLPQVLNQVVTALLTQDEYFEEVIEDIDQITNLLENRLHLIDEGNF